MGEMEALDMRRSKGTRQGTRSILRRDKHQRGRFSIRRILHEYEEGDRVAIVLDGGQQMGMPHRRFQGRTGFIDKKQGCAYVIAVKDGNMQKTVIARPEHLRPLE
jgi:large subunit ribosomal protein L21e